MKLLAVRLVGVGPFEDTVLPFCDDRGEPRRVTVVYGGGGVGKTTVLAALGATRPGNTVVLSTSVIGAPSEPRDVPPFAICDWLLGADDPGRPHPLRVVTPGVRTCPSDEEETFRRREQALFDKRAAQGGFAFLLLPAHRWFSRQPVGLNAPARTVARYDVRAAGAVDEATRSDLTRETKQALAYGAIAASLSAAGGDRGRRLDLLGAALREVVDALAGLAGFSYRGLDAASFEPVFVGSDGRNRSFDALPTRARHLVAFAALAVRLLWASRPGHDPRESEAVIAIDEVDLHQDASAQTALASTLTRALPGVQWILTTSSPLVAGSVDAHDVLALRRLPETDRVALHLGDEARIH